MKKSYMIPALFACSGLCMAGTASRRCSGCGGG